MPVVDGTTSVPGDETATSWFVDSNKVVGLVLNVAGVEGLKGIPAVVRVTGRVDEPEVVGIVEWDVFLVEERSDVIRGIVPSGETEDNVLRVVVIGGVVEGNNGGGAGVINPVGEGRDVEDEERGQFMVSILVHDGRVLGIRVQEDTVSSVFIAVSIEESGGQVDS